MSDMGDLAPDILVVDDTPENISILRQILVEHGFRVRPALSGEIALKAVQASRPNLILLDIMMPGMDGFEVCRTLKSDAETRDIPVLFISALDESEDKIKGFQAGGVDYITKPFQCEEVLVRVETHLKLRNMQTELEQALEELKNAQKKLLQTERMAAIGTMAGGVAHDLNNILSGIVGYPDLLLAQLPEKSNLREGIKIMRESGLRVVDDLLVLSRGSGYNTVINDLNFLIERSLQSDEAAGLKRQQPGITIDCRLAPDLWFAISSPAHIEKVILKLLTNAFHSMGGRGRIVVATENRKIEKGPESLTFLDLAPGNYVVLSVTDSGPAITREDCDRFFEPFYAKRMLRRGGVGLDLTVVWHTAKAHMGAVTVESGKGGNTVFFILPAAPVESPGREKAPPQGSLEGSGTVMIVDDEAQLRALASQMLSQLGYRAVAVSSGEEAVAHLRREDVDLVLLDMVMPAGMGGYETFLAIASAKPEQRVVICSGYSEHEDLQKMRDAGIHRFLGKPYTLEQLGRAVGDALRENV
ncbi:MAG: response regulator [Thermodesulfobacteriota bacterium]